MGINIANTVLTGPSGNSVSVADSSGNLIYKQDSSGYVHGIQTSGGSALTPMFNVGAPDTGAWVSLTTSVWNTIPFNYTSGGGYTNVNSCYNTSTYRFTAPWNGIYMFKMHLYIYAPNGTYGWYIHPQFAVNGSVGARRPYTTPYRMRLFGIPASYGHDTDCCELINLVAGDYVQVMLYTNGSTQYYSPYCAWAGSYVGSY